jgi:hypothetical protein
VSGSELRIPVADQEPKRVCALAKVHRAQSGGIIVFVCSNLGNGPAGTPACPAAPATTSGTIRPADIIGPADRGLMAGQFAALVAAIRAKTAYANVHSTTFPGGEIRGQLVNQ